MATNLITKLVKNHKKGLDMKEEIDAQLGLSEPLTLVQLRLLWSIQGGPLRMGQIALKAESSYQLTGKYLGKLAADKAPLVKTYPDPEDARKTYCELTKRGIALLAKLG